MRVPYSLAQGSTLENIALALDINRAVSVAEAFIKVYHLRAVLSFVLAKLGVIFHSF